MNRVELESKVTDFIQRHGLIPRKELIVVGVSGGADSVCLLHVLAAWRKRLGIKLHIAHLNHQIRGAESQADAEYVSDLAGSLDIPVTIDRQDVAAYRTERKCSLEEAARELRYAFFAGVARRVGARRIAIGHTRDDQVETILMHILRGTGIAGLCGLAPCSPLVHDSQGASLPAKAPTVPEDQRSNILVIRPLLDITREETASYCQKHQLDPRLDSSNLSPSFFRNRLRLHLLPLLRQYNPSVDQALLRLADIAKEDNVFIEQQASGLWGEVARQENNAIYLSKKQIAALPIALQRQLLRTAVTKLAGDNRDIEASHIEAARSLLDKPASKRTGLPHGLVCHGGYAELVIASTSKQSQLPPCPFPPLSDEFHLKVPGKTAFSGWNVLASIVREHVAFPSSQGAMSTSQRACQSNLVAHFDLQKTGMNLCVRKRRPGDRFQPLGMNMPKKVHEFMVDAKIPRSWRGCIPIVSSAQQIIWVVGWRIDDRAKLTEASEEILRLEFIRSE
ncbi:MAG: tRNA lysidine(34) synthetase TilS [Dehalococcoidia bacterium]|nr:tRNA lysidine(34) synthetase TilS [Dehalococcoidia bacterium]MDH4367859.1 tRNA lysidine(34) synthetase TilS [Dehalococcoidia bacterium]